MGRVTKTRSPQYKELYDLETLSTVHFAVELTPFARNAEIASKQIEIYTPESKWWTTEKGQAGGTFL